LQQEEGLLSAMTAQCAACETWNAHPSYIYVYSSRLPIGSRCL